MSLAAILISGCATSLDKPRQSIPPSVTRAEEDRNDTTSSDGPTQSIPPSVKSAEEDRKDPFSFLPERYRVKAREHEKKGDLPKALMAWEVVLRFNPGDAETAGRVASLKKQIPALADMHFQKGLTLFKGHSYALARKEFLSALYLNPDHAEAIHYLKEKLGGEDFLTYEVKKGDTLQEVALKVYKDPQKDFVIAYFNGLKGDGPIQPPRILKMPILGPLPPKKAPASAKSAAGVKSEKTVGIQDTLGKGRSAYAENNYQESAALMEKVLEYDSTNREARELVNASYYQLGKQLGEEKKYREALETFERVDPGYKDVRAQIAQNQKILAEAHYLKGVGFFAGEEIESAIQEWEATLALNPKHPKAKKDIENARNLLQKLEKVK